MNMEEVKINGEMNMEEVKINGEMNMEEVKINGEKLENLGPLISSLTISDGIINPKTESNYIIFQDGITINAKNGNTGKIDFSGTNASAVINSAISTLTTGGKIFIKGGIYKLNSGFNFSVRRISLVGEENTILQANADIDVLTIDPNFSSVIIGNLSIESTVSNPTKNGIVIKGYSNTIESVKIKGFYNGIYIYGAYNTGGPSTIYSYWNEVRNCIIDYNIHDGIMMDGNEGYVSNLVLVNTDVTHSGNDGVQLTRNCVVIGGQASYNGRYGYTSMAAGYAGPHFMQTYAEGNALQNIKGWNGSGGFLGTYGENPYFNLVDSRYGGSSIGYEGFYSRFFLGSTIVPKSDGQLDVGQPAVQWKDGYFKGLISSRRDVGNYGGNFINYNPPSGREGALLIAEDTNASNPKRRLYVYSGGAWRYADLT